MREAIIYKQDGCDLCSEVKRVLKKKLFTLREREADSLIKGHDQNMDAMAQLAIQNMELPLVLIEGEWRMPREVIKWGE